MTKKKHYVWRKEFDAWAKSVGYDTTKLPGGEYDHDATSIAADGWQACDSRYRALLDDVSKRLDGHLELPVTDDFQKGWNRAILMVRETLTKLQSTEEICTK